MRGSASALVACLSLFTGIPAEAKTVEQSLREHISVLASDEYEGRAPGTPGEQKTLSYIMAAWQKAGLQPGAEGNSWFAPVPLMQHAPVTSKFSFATNEKKLRFIADEAILIGRDETYRKSDVPLVFGGYGITADGSVIEGVAGKVVLILFDTPNFGPPDMKSVRARREALVKAGAEAVLIVADNGQGNWSAIRRQLLSRPITLQTKDVKAPIEGAISSEFAVGLVTAAGRDWDKLRAAAKNANFVVQELGIKGDFDVVTSIRRFDSQNVIGKIPGKKKGSGAVVFMAHWDHLGICEPESAIDKICNGAVDNASGIAVLTEIARGLAKKREDRDIYFVATTAEESGLLGAYAFVDKPPMPLDSIVAALNLDTAAVAPAGARVTIIARGLTPLDATVDGVTKKMGRKPETSLAANAFLQRQDGWALTQKGVPAIMVGSAFADEGLLQAFLDSDYHGPNDELTPETVLSGAAEDVALHIELGRTFANTRKYTPPAKTK